MKKAIGLIISILLTLSLCACSWLQNLSYNAEVEKALAVLEDGWSEYYVEREAGDGHVEIRDTRVVKLKENIPEHLQEVDCIVSFDLYTDYLCFAPYYMNVKTMDSVIIYKDGRAELQQMDPLIVYLRKNYKNDVTVEVIDLGNAYNRTWDLK